MDDPKPLILARRARFVAAALASVGGPLVGCAKPPTETTIRPLDEGDAQVVVPTTARPPDDDPVPCLSPVPPDPLDSLPRPPPRVRDAGTAPVPCLSVAPRRSPGDAEP
jgi:hypothetical protein